MLFLTAHDVSVPPKLFKMATHKYVRPRKDHRAFDLISDALPFGRLWYEEASAAVDYAKYSSRSHRAVIRVYDHAGNVIETRQSEGADREASNELFSRDFSDENEIHSTPTSSREHANTVGDRFPQRVRSSWFGGLLRWRARAGCHTDSGCDRNACANSHPVSNFCAAQHSAPVRWIGSAHHETLSAAMRGSNPDRSPLRING
jgi:hypothetical protein